MATCTATNGLCDDGLANKKFLDEWVHDLNPVFAAGYKTDVYDTESHARR